MGKPSDEEFFDIATNLVEEEADDLLNKRLALVEKWARVREARGQRADFLSLHEQMLREPSPRGPVITALAAALWRLREQEKADARTHE